jgi:hypothetical protein
MSKTTMPIAYDPAMANPSMQGEKNQLQVLTELEAPTILRQLGRLEHKKTSLVNPLLICQVAS